jgi:two-component system, OmpR family, sensor kinase
MVSSQSIRKGILRPRLSLRARLALLFALGSSLVVVAGGLLLITDQRRNADENVTTSLRNRIDEIVKELEKNSRLPLLESYAQIFTQTGRVVTISASLQDEQLLTRQQLVLLFRETRQRSELQIERPLPGLPGRGRLLAQRRTIGPDSVVVVVGSSLRLQTQQRSRLLITLAIGGPGLIALLGLGGWLLASAALRPVRKMTDEASAISRADTGRRLPLPSANDEIGHLGQTLNAMLDRLETSFLREQSFVDDASHELRTPLAVLRGELELALLHPGDANETVATLQRCAVEVDRLSSLAQDLLVLARAGSSARDPKAQTDVVAVAREVTDRLRPILRPEIVVVVVGTTSYARIERARLMQILENVIANAARFATSNVYITVDHAPSTQTAETTETTDHSVAVESEANIAPRSESSASEGASSVPLPPDAIQSFVRILVRDDGPGFPADFLPHAFERFSVANRSRGRTTAAGSTGTGNGIGLAIVRAAAERAGGRVKAENVAGPTNGSFADSDHPANGAIITIWLPSA